MLRLLCFGFVGVGVCFQRKERKKKKMKGRTRRTKTPENEKREMRIKRDVELSKALENAAPRFSRLSRIERKLQPIFAGGSKEATIEEAVRMFSTGGEMSKQNCDEFERYYGFGMMFIAWEKFPTTTTKEEEEEGGGLHKFATKRLSTSLFAEIIVRADLKREFVRMVVSMKGASDGVCESVFVILLAFKIVCISFLVT